MLVDIVHRAPRQFGEEQSRWTLAASHTAESGAVTPGGMPLAAKNRFYEGMKLPPITATSHAA